MTEIPDLAWDYTGDESSPLLQRAVSPVWRSDDFCRLTHRQTQHLMRNLGESVQIIRSARQFHPAGNGDTIHDVSFDEIDASCCQRIWRWLWSGCARASRFASLLAILLQIIAVLIESVWDAIAKISANESHHPYVQAIVTPICLVLIALVYIEIVRHMRRGHLTFYIWLKSFISSIVTFAGVYSIFLRFNGLAEHEVYVVTYLKMTHYAISIFTFTGTYVNSGMYECWYALTILTLQMLFAYFHLVLIISHFSHFIPTTQQYTPSPNVNVDFHTPIPVVREVEIYDTDSEVFVTPHSTLIHNSSGTSERGALGAMLARVNLNDDINSGSRYEDVPDCDILLSNSI